MRKKSHMSSQEIISGYESYGATATDALNDARLFGYQHHYNTGFAHGAIAAGIGAILGGIVDLLIERRDSERIAKKKAMELCSIRNASLTLNTDGDSSREENND